LPALPTIKLPIPTLSLPKIPSIPVFKLDLDIPGLPALPTIKLPIPTLKLPTIPSLPNFNISCPLD
jgi:hypothetical protein